MKVLQLVPSVSLVYGGPSQMILGFSQALAEQGVDITLLTTDSNGDSGQDPLDVPLNQAIPQDGYQIRYYRCSPFRRYKFSLPLFQWLWNHARDYDLVHIHALFSPVSSLSAWICRQRGVPYVLRPLGTLDPADLRKKSRLKDLYARVLERENLAQAAAIHFTTAEEAKISHRFGVKTQDWVIPLGVTPPNPPVGIDEICHQLGVDATRPLVLFMSRVEPKKGLDLLIPALEAVAAKGIEFQFVLAGSNPQDPAYEQKIGDRLRQSSIHKQTRFTGFVRGETKAALLHRADVFVLPSYYENFGIAVAEAMGVGTPVLISDRVQICDAVAASESGWVADCSLESVRDRLVEALTHLDDCQRRGNNARTYATLHYRWPAIAQQAIEHYQRII